MLVLECVETKKKKKKRGGGGGGVLVSITTEKVYRDRAS